MNIMITGRHIEVTEAIRNHVAMRVEAVLADTATLKVSSVRVILDYEHKQGAVEILVSMKNHEVIGTARDHDMYKAIDLAADRLATQITRHIKRVKDHRAAPYREVSEMVPQ